MKVFVMGLDCAEPSIVFEHRAELPTLDKLMRAGVWGKLRSTIPCITVPAWVSMTTGCDPGELGLYGFRNRHDYNYGTLEIANSNSVHVPRLWDTLSQAGKRVIVVGVPLTYPVQAVNGYMVSDFMTPETTYHQYTYPNALRREIEIATGGGEYLVDVKDFRSDDKMGVESQVWTMTEQHFAVLDRLIRMEWDFFMAVEIGLDRLQHALWKSPGNIMLYYRFLDDRLGNLLRHLDDDTAILVVSDHGAQAMEGGVRINEILKRYGYLGVKDGEIEWDRTLAWGEGGYYARIFLNVRGREPNGVVLDKFSACNAIAATIEGEVPGSICYRPEQIYKKLNGIPPDLLVYLGGLRYRAIGGIEDGPIFVEHNDTGPDDANHAPDGILIASTHAGAVYPGNLDGMSILDVYPFVLGLMGVQA